MSAAGSTPTGVYWKPVYYALEDDFELLLVNAQHVKNVPGRKTDTQDAQWLCQLLECGLLRPSFVPPKPIRELRDLTRVSPLAEQGAPAGGQPAAQGARRRRDQARLRGNRCARRLRPSDARGADLGDPRSGGPGRAGPWTAASQAACAQASAGRELQAPPRADRLAHP